MTVARIGIDYRPALLAKQGIPRAVRELCRELAWRDDLELRLFGHSLAAARVPEPASARLCRLPIPGRSLPLLAGLGLDAGRLCGGVDLFHWTDYIHPPLRRGTRAVLTLHDCAFAVDPEFHGADTTTLRERTRRAAERAAMVICPSAATARDATEHLGIPESRLRVIPFGADHALTSPRRETAANAPIVMLGTVEPRKNHLRALAAWRALGPDRPELVVVGRSGWCCDEAERALRAAEQEGGLRWLRDADDPTVTRLLASAAALLYPSLLEGFGFPPLEALAHGCPVVAGDVPALREVLGDVACYCDPREIDSIRTALELALASHEQSEARATLRRGHASRYRWAACAAEHAALYQEVIG